MCIPVQTQAGCRLSDPIRRFRQETMLWLSKRQKQSRITRSKPRQKGGPFGMLWPQRSMYCTCELFMLTGITLSRLRLSPACALPVGKSRQEFLRTCRGLCSNRIGPGSRSTMHKTSLDCRRESSAPRIAEYRLRRPAPAVFFGTRAPWTDRDAYSPSQPLSYPRRHIE